MELGRMGEGREGCVEGGREGGEGEGIRVEGGSSCTKIQLSLILIFV